MTTKGLLRAALLALGMMVLVLALPAAAQEARAPRAALLVVDSFAPDGAPTVYADEVQGRACAVEVKGQDGFIRIRGPKPLRSAHLPANDQPYPLAFPHGDLVRMHIRDVLSARGFQPATPPSPPNSLEPELWSGPNGEELLVFPVDTQGFTLGVIGPRMVDAVAEVRQMGYERIVVNMSFAIIPCSSMPVFSLEQYQLQLGDWDALRLFTDDAPPGTALEQVVLDLAQAARADAAESTANFAAQMAAQPEKETSNLDQVIVRLREGGGPDAAAFAVLHTNAMERQIEAALAATYGEVAPQATARPTAGSVVDDFEQFGQTLDDLAKSGVALVASAGNDGLAQAYYPAAYDSVLAVSADYPLRECPPGTRRQIRSFLRGLGFTDAAIEDQTNALYHPLSNSGEVEADGVSRLTPDRYLVNPPPGAEALGCLTGTSYSAPDVSVQMALYFLEGGHIQCRGLLGSSRPPLAHAPYDNLDVPEAAFRYCSDFP